MSVILGKDIETGTSVKIGEIERYGGLYILGKAGTGKSNLLIFLALQDIVQGNGLLFIDPHADAINKILERVPNTRKKDVILLDPTDRNYAFGINPLYCADPDDLHERERAFGQARDIFAKLTMLFGESDEKLKVLLSKYLRNILYPLIENQGSTLYDITMMLTNKPFREHLLSHVKYAPDVVDFWHYQFDTLSKHDQYEELKSTFNRISLFERPYIRDIISQPKPTIDFTKIMEDRKIVLLKLPMSPSDDETRSFIGTLVISQLLKVIFLRADISEHLRVPFALYCDEFHNFATPDFAKLFAQTRKFKIMPVVAHQNRAQFKSDDPNKGATLGAPNKVHFSLSTPDAEEFAKEVARKPPTETKKERELVISQSPLEDLLQGHKNPEIQQFVDGHLRHLHEWGEDIKKEIEEGKLNRMRRADETALIRLSAQYEGTTHHRFKDEDTIERVKGLLTEEAKSIKSSLLEDADLRVLQMLENDLTQNQRFLDRFLTKVMERQITPRHQEFADFLAFYIQSFPGLPEKYIPLFKQFIMLQYGDSAQSFLPDVKETKKDECMRELFKIKEYKEKPLHMLLFINQFAHFCDLLSKPENHILKPTGQYVEKQSPQRTVADMVGEMRGELTDLPNYTAYAKILQEKHKITTFELPEKLPISVITQTQQDILEQTHREYCQGREIIEREIREKQKAWQKESDEKPPSSGRRN